MSDNAETRESLRARIVQALGDTICDHAAEYGWASCLECDADAVLAALPPVAGPEVRPDETQWWVTTDALGRGGKKVIGPFISQELALRVRALIETVESRNDLWVDEETQR